MPKRPSKPPEGAAKPSKAPSPRWLGLTAAATEIDLSVRQLQEYAKRPNAPRKSDGKGGWLYEWPAFNRFVREQLAEDVRESSKPVDFEEAKTRKMAAEAELAEMELATARGAMVAVTDVAGRLAKILERVRSRFVAVPGKLAPRLVGVETAMEARGVLEEAVGEILTELSADPDAAPAPLKRKAA